MPEGIPKTVERYVEEHKDQGQDEEKAWAIAWSRYCSKNPDSPHCKKDEYFPNKPEIAEGIKNSFHKESYMSLKKRLVKLGEKRKDLRSHIRPVLSYIDKEAVKIENLNETYGRIEKIMKKVFEGCRPRQTKGRRRRIYDVEIQGDNVYADVEVKVNDDGIKVNEIEMRFKDKSRRREIGKGRIRLPKNHSQPSPRSLRDKLQGIKGKIRSQINKLKRQQHHQNIHSSLVKLGQKRKDLRPHIRPVLDKISERE